MKKAVHQPHDILKQYWGFDRFRPMQEEIVQSVIDGHDTLALLPTGGGKSLCFQVPAMCMEGLCIVVSPLIALIRDQVINLHQRGIKATAIHSGLPKGEIDRLLNNAVFGETKFLYVSPERLGTEEFKVRVKDMKVNLIAIDEAHCISQWGYDFRPAYLKIIELRELLPAIPVIALTATATRPVVRDIQNKLLFTNEKVFQKSFVRHNLSYVLRQADDKNQQLLDILKKVKGSSIVYVRSRRKTKEVSDYLRRNRISADFYHAGLENDERNKRQSAWLENKIQVIVCTNAFGMGIDKPDVRSVIHIEPTESIEAYFQEAGRAGRDEQKAYAIQLITTGDNEDLLKSKIEHIPAYKEVKDIYDSICGEANIAYNTGMGYAFDFDISVYARQHGYSPVKVMNVLNLLESQELLQVSDGFQSSAKIKFITGKDVLYKFQVEHRNFEPIIKMILRTCSGVFEDYVNFNEMAIGAKLKLSADQSVTALQRLNDLHIASYIPKREKPQVTLLQNRIKKEELILDKKFIEQRIEGFKERIDSVRGYINNTTICLSKYLVQYFGEMDAEDCGICSVCLSRKKEVLSAIEFETIANMIIEMSKEPMSFHDIDINIDAGIEKIKQVIEWLTDNGKIGRTEDGRIFSKQ
jgi:ATP-dependent DNA helicase RecQ